MVTTSEWIGTNEFLRRNKGRLGRNKFYRLLADGTLKPVTLKLGSRILIREDALDMLLEIEQTKPVATVKKQ